MAKLRVEIPLVILDTQGEPVTNASATIYVRGTSNIATAYNAETGGSVLPAPLAADSAGRISGWVERGAYTAVITAPGMGTWNEEFEASPAKDGGIDGAWLQDASVTLAKLAADAAYTMILGGVVDYPWAASTIPAWTALPYGQAISRGAYSGLAAVAAASGYPHGNGDGTLTFNLPDYRGRLGVGLDNMGGSAANRITVAISGTNGQVVGATLGAEGVTLTSATIPAHTHPLSGSPAVSESPHGHVSGAHNHRMNRAESGGGGGFFVQVSGNGYLSSDYMGEAIAVTINTNTTGITVSKGTLATDSIGSGGAHLNMPPSVMVNKLMRVL